MFARNKNGPAAKKQVASSISKAMIDIVKKYRRDKAGTGVRSWLGSSKLNYKKLGTIKTLLDTYNKKKIEEFRHLVAVQRRMHERVEEHVKSQQKIKDEERDQVKWMEEEYKRNRLENSCLNIEKHKL